MDDYLDSTHTIKEAMKRSKDVTGALKEGGFRLTIWLSKDQHKLDKMPSQELSPTLVILDFGNLPIERTLRILWNLSKYIIWVKATAEDVPLAERGILSYTSSILDLFIL